MPLDTITDVIEWIADQAGIYGAHDEENDPEGCRCRVCWTNDVRDRLDSAYDLEAILAKSLTRG